MKVLSRILVFSRYFVMFLSLSNDLNPFLCFGAILTSCGNHATNAEEGRVYVSLKCRTFVVSNTIQTMAVFTLEDVLNV